MFIAGVFRYGKSKRWRTGLRHLIFSICVKLSHRSKACYYIFGDGFSFVSNNPQTKDKNRFPGNEYLRGLEIVYSGKFFDIGQLKKRLSLHDGDSLENAIKKAYMVWGYDFVKRLKGEFAVALYDKTQARLILARDRIGLQPLYYYIDGKVIIFASEKNALLQYKRKMIINYSCIHANILYSSTYSREQQFKGIYELRPGNMLTIHLESKRPGIYKYWDIRFNIIRRDFSYYRNGFRYLFEESIKKRLPPDGSKIGVASSGGIDSALIISFLTRFYQRKIETFTIGPRESGRYFNRKHEYKDARMVSRYFNTKHHELLVYSREVIGYLPRVIWHMGEIPCFGVSISQGIMVYLLGRLAKKNGCRCIFTGNGVELILDGNDPQRELYKRMHHSNKIPEKIRDEFIPHLPRALKKRLHIWSTSDMKNIEEKYIRRNSPWHKEAVLRNYYTGSFRNKLKAFRAKTVLKDYLMQCDAKDYFNKLLYIDLKTWNSRRNLIINERLLAASGIKLEIPFIDAELVEFCCRMPLNVKHHFSDKKYFLRRLYKNYIPKKISNKGKQGSNMGFNLSSSKAREIVLHFVNLTRERGLFKKSFIDKLLSGCKNNPRAINDKMFCLFTIELWFRIFVDNHDIEEKNLTYDYLG